MKSLLSNIVIVGITLFTSFSWASFDGNTVQGEYYFPNLGSPLNGPVTAVVGPGVEFTNFPSGDQRTNVDISASNIRITYLSASTWSSATFNGPVFRDINGTIPPITGVSINPATNMVGLDISRVTFDADSVSINWNGLPFDTSTVVSIDVQFGGTAQPQSVPSLSLYGIVMLSMLLAAVGYVASRSRIKA